MGKFKLRFPVTQIEELSGRYRADNDNDNEAIERIIKPKVRETGYLDKVSFLTVCRWKTPRTQKRCRENNEEFVREVTGLALGGASEQMRISVLTLLNGVQWPTASVILHFFHKERYPIVDFRALWSLNSEVPAQYDFEFWQAYTKCCRELADEAGVSMRTLDRALWQFSNERQK